MEYLLDTNICIYVIKQKPLSVINNIQNKKLSEIAISSITLAELEYGIEKSKFPEKNRIALYEFLVPFEIINFDQKASLEYGKLRSYLERNGNLIGPMDMLIGAHAISEKLILVTNNEKDFIRIKNIKIENWAI